MLFKLERNTMQKSSFLFLLLSALVLPLNSHASPDVVAKVAALRNLVTATSQSGETRQLTPKDPIHKGDTIQTGPRGRIQILFTDNTIISLGRNTNLAIHEYLWQPELKNGALRTEVKEGIFRVMGGAITKTNPEKFTTKTPAATIGIRGSMYAGRVSDNSLSVVFQGGRGIFVENGHGRVEIHTPGHGTNVSPSQPPPPPVRFTPQEIDSLAPGEESANNEEQGEDGDAPPPATEEETSPAPPLEDGEGPSPVPTEPLPTYSTTVGDIVSDLPPANETTPPAIASTPWAPPATGITHFNGSVSGTVTKNDGTTEPIDESLELLANWHNNTIIGSSSDLVYQSMPVYFFGKISGTSVTDIIFFGGSGGDSTIDVGVGGDNTIDVVEGTGTGSFSGYAYGIFNMTASGSDYSIEPFDQPVFSTWSASAQAQEGTTKPSDSGSSTWKGYAVGLSENMADINTNRHLIRNANHGDFTMTINKDTGTVSGRLQATDGTFTTNLNVGGGTTSSAYVHDQLIVALLNGTITTATTDSLKDHGNYMFSGPMDEQTTEYATWGYWEIAYQNPGTSEQYHNHVPGAMWIAGVPTSSTDLAALAAGNVVGQYNGDVRGSRIQTGGMVNEVNGTFQMDVNFAELGTAGAFAGTMQLDGHNFTTQSISGPGDGQFTNGLISGDGYTGDISGTLYGPAATSIGGNFTTSTTTETYQGIYGGNR